MVTNHTDDYGNNGITQASKEYFRVNDNIFIFYLSLIC